MRVILAHAQSVYFEKKGAFTGATSTSHVKVRARARARACACVCACVRACVCVRVRSGWGGGGIAGGRAARAAGGVGEGERATAREGWLRPSLSLPPSLPPSPVCVGGLGLVCALREWGLDVLCACFASLSA